MHGEMMAKAINEGIQLSGWIYQGEKILFPVFTLPDGSVIVITDVKGYKNLQSLINEINDCEIDGVYNYQPWPGPDPSAGELKELPIKPSKKDLSTPWSPHQIIIGYEQRINPDGYLETRKIETRKKE